MIYIDTSSLLKLVITDEFSTATDLALSRESAVLVSNLTELEARVQLKALLLAGTVGKARASRIRDNLITTIAKSPFELRSLPGSVFRRAIAQNENSKVHCRSLDRIHLAAMAELGIKRLMTHDERQSKAAKELGYKVVMPGIG